MQPYETDTVTLPTEPVAANPVTGARAEPSVVATPTCPVADTPVVVTLAVKLTVTLPTAPVAETPSTETLRTGVPHEPSFQVDLPQPENRVDEAIS